MGRHRLDHSAACRYRGVVMFPAVEYGGRRRREPPYPERVAARAWPWTPWTTGPSCRPCRTWTTLRLSRRRGSADNQLQVRHIFPKSRLYQKGYHHPEVNALANFCFLIKDMNLQISDRFPEEYFPEVESKHPGVLASQWIPTDPELWKVENYLDFLTERRRLLAAETNRHMEELLHGDTRWLAGAARPALVPGGITNDDEEAELEALNEWVEAQGLPRGQMAFDYTDPDTNEQLAVFDLAWPNGVQVEIS